MRGILNVLNTIKKVITMGICEFCGYPFSDCICELNADGGDWMTDTYETLKEEAEEEEEWWHELKTKDYIMFSKLKTVY